jgi:phage I-like protein
MPVDVTEEYIRIRQKDPGSFKKGAMKDGSDFNIMTLDTAKGIRAIIGILKGKNTTEVQSYLFRRDKGWNATKAQAWVDKHKGGHRSKEWQARASGYEGDRDLVVRMRGTTHFMLSELSIEEQGEQVNLFEAADRGITLNRAGVAHAKSLIKTGHVKDDAAWGFSAADGNRILGKAPKDATPADWKRYASWHMGINQAAKENSKDRYKFPFGKGGNLYRRALRAVAQRASQFNYPKISEAASAMIEILRKEEEVKTRDEDFILLRLTEFVETENFCLKLEEDEDGKGKPPSEFRIVAYGTWSTSKYGDLKVDRESAKTVMAYYKMKGLDKLPIDWEHQTYNTQLNGMPAPAIGFFKPEIRDDGIWAVEVEWTPQAVEWLENKQYRHFSPTGQLDRKSGRLVNIKTLALTNLPATNHQEPLVADDKGEGTSGGTMDLIMAALGLTPEDTEEKAVKAIEDIKAKADAHGKDLETKDKEIADLKAKDTPEPDKALTDFRASVIEQCGLKEDAKPEDVKAHIATLKAQEPNKAEMAELKSKVVDLEAKQEATRVKDLLGEFVAKETPANKEIMEDLAKSLPAEKFRATMAMWPDVKGDGPKPAGDKGIDERNKPTEFKLTETDERIIKDRLQEAGVERDSKEGKEIVAKWEAAKKQGHAQMAEFGE